LRILIFVGLAFLVSPRTLAAQAKPAGAERVWLELGLGGSRQDPACDGCAQRSKMGGPSASLAGGITITPRFGVAAQLREFAEFSFDYSHSATYIVGLAQYSRAGTDWLTVNAGLGYGAQSGDEPPYGDNGGGAVVVAGIAMRLPSASTFALTLNVDWMKSITGNVQTTSGQGGSSYRPLLFTIDLGLNIAGSGVSQ
jgi:hypothetical protein